MLSLAALLVSPFVAGISAQSMDARMKGPAARSAAKLTEDQRIQHVLNRLGFGARPGDVERVKAMGIDAYINQQLWPEKIDDTASEAKLQNLESLRMTTAELYEKYPRFGEGLAEAVRERAQTLEGTDLGGLYANLADFRLVASREEEHLAGLADRVAPAPVVRVPFLRTDVHDLDGLSEVGTFLFA